jgi:hypothetical protein
LYFQYFECEFPDNRETGNNKEFFSPTSETAPVKKQPVQVQSLHKANILETCGYLMAAPERTSAAHRSCARRSR